jgi:glyceraldehyde 3-phosphate dehydrogenase
MARIAIHGFGRIGRSLMRVALKDKLFVPVSISDIRDVPTLAALFDVDSNYGRWPEEVTSKDSCFASAVARFLTSTRRRHFRTGRPSASIW